jgi:glycosyltransferase involved in cell wall biosynthesis
LKILHIANDFFPSYLGTPVRLYNLLNGLPAEIALYIPRRENQTDQRLSNIYVRRIPVLRGGPLSHLPYLSYILSMHRWYQSFVRAAEQEEFDIVHGHTPLRFGFIAQKIAQKLHKPFIYEAHGLNVDYYQNMVARLNPLYPLGYAYVKTREKQLLALSVRIICLTQALKARIQALYHIPDRKISVVPNGVDVDKFSPDIDCTRLKTRLRLSGKIVMYAGYLNKVNGIHALEWLIPRVLRKRPDTSFVLIGRGPAEKTVQDLSRRYPANVKYLGLVPYDEMPLYYRLSDVFIIPRPHTMSAETLTPLKLLEAMAMASCVLASDVGGMREVIDSGRNGFLFHTGDLNEMEKSLLRILESDTSAVGLAARRTIAERYSWEKSRQTLTQIYQSIL